MRTLPSAQAVWRQSLWLAVALTTRCAGQYGCAQLPGIYPDPGELWESQLNGGLVGELNRACAAVSEARDAAVSAKAELEAAIAAGALANESVRPDDKRAAPSSTSQSRAESAAVADANAEELATLRRLIAELKAERMELLAHLTHQHPLIIDADLRLAEYQRQLVVLTARPTTNQGTGQDERTLRFAVEDTSLAVEATPSSPPSAIEQEADQRLRAGSQRLRQAMAKWDTAQAMLEAAVDAESATAERIAAMASEQARSQHAAAAIPLAETSAQEGVAQEEDNVEESQAETPDEPDTATASNTAAVSDSENARGSQPLVLAALILALVIAAIASVTLARATDESVFAGADDAAAVLLLPVLGVIPAATPALAHGTVFQRHQTLTFLAQVLVAVVVFALVAYCVENPGSVWQLIRDPASAWR